MLTRVPLGDAILTKGGGPSEVPTPRKGPVLRTVKASIAEIIKRSVDHLRRRPVTGPIAGYHVYEDRATGVRLWEPVIGAAPKPSPSAPDRERARAIIEGYVAASKGGVPPLFEEFPNELTMAMLDVLPVRIAVDSPLRNSLLNARIVTAGSVLRYRPDDLYVRIAKSQHPTELTAVIRDNRDFAELIARSVTRAISEFSKTTGVVSPDGLAGDEQRSKFVEVVAKKLGASDKKGVPELPSALVDAVVRRALRSLERRRE